MMHRLGWTGPRNSSQDNHAWFKWQRGYRGPTLIHRVTVPKLPPRDEDDWRVPYDPDADIRESVKEGFRAIRERKAQGGPGWGEHSDYPDLPTCLRRTPIVDEAAS